MEYDIITAGTAKELSVKVNEKTKEGWFTEGGHSAIQIGRRINSTYSYEHYQAMTKES